MSVERIIVLAVEVQVTTAEDHSGMTPDQLAEAVWALTEEQRTALILEAQAVALQLLFGKPLEID